LREKLESEWNSERLYGCFFGVSRLGKRRKDRERQTPLQGTERERERERDRERDDDDDDEDGDDICTDG